jgi:putative restriction endonuclease
MLTEEGYDRALNILGISLNKNEILSVRSYEVEQIAKTIITQCRPENYNPFQTEKEISTVTREAIIRQRGFRQAVIESYDFKCAVCQMKICSPNQLQWEVEAAHIVPHSARGKDDVWNGLALCRLHHWAFDVGWFALEDDYKVIVSSRIHELPGDFGKMGNCDFIGRLCNENLVISLPKNYQVYPHPHALQWHRKNILYK